MNEELHNLDALLDRVAAGDLDGLSPDEVDALAAHLDANEQAAARLGPVMPPADLTGSDPVDPPDAVEWAQVYREIEAAGAPRTLRILRAPAWLGSTLAAAACLLFAFLWGPLFESAAPSPGDAWELTLGDDVQVLELEVGGGYTSFVSYDDGGGAAMVWIYEDSSDAAGA